MTRQELATFLYRYAQYKGKGFTGSWMFPLDYPDVADVADYANEAMHWMTMKGIVKGKADGKLAPKAGATRAEIAVMLTRLIDELAK